jgi:hypothetical protein
MRDLNAPHGRAMAILLQGRAEATRQKANPRRGWRPLLARRHQSEALDVGASSALQSEGRLQHLQNLSHFRLAERRRPWLTRMEKPAKVIFIIVLVLAAFGSTAFATCGTQGGPGYRDSSGKCVGWESLCRVCGSPPTLRWTPENVAPEAEDGAADCQKNQDRKDRQHHRVRDQRQKFLKRSGASSV